MPLDYPELIAEVTERTGDSGVATRAPMYLRMAEADLNKRLRVGDSEKVVTLTTDADGNADLPADFYELRDLFIRGERVRNALLPDQYAPRSYTIQGKQITSAYPEQDIVLHYYAGLPSLDVIGTNWLLESEPEVYLYALMKQAFLFRLDTEKAAACETVLGALIAEVLRVDRIKRFGKLPYRVAGITP
jgi:hypothetical protein